MLFCVTRGNSGRDESGGPSRRHIVAAVVTCAAIGAALVHAVAPDLKFDSVTVVLLTVAVVPWLGDLFDSIGLPGGTKPQYKQLVARVEATERGVDGASRTARVALVAVVGGAKGDETSDPAAREAVERLAAEYTAVRQSMGSGRARTNRMERIFAELVSAAPRVHGFDVDAALKSDDPGVRLAAYAYLYAAPDATKLRPLVDAVVDEPLSFSQYWGFGAVEMVVDDIDSDQVPARVVRRLEDCLTALPSGNDRIGVLRRILGAIDDHR